MPLPAVCSQGRRLTLQTGFEMLNAVKHPTQQAQLNLTG